MTVASHQTRGEYTSLGLRVTAIVISFITLFFGFIGMVMIGTDVGQDHPLLGKIVMCCGAAACGSLSTTLWDASVDLWREARTR